MAYNTSLANATSFYTKGNTSQNNKEVKVIGRVVDIILDSSHPDYKIFGSEEAINGIRYKTITSSQNETNPSSLPFAYCGYYGVSRVPLINELVEVVLEPGNSAFESNYKPKAYYTRILNLWNNAHHNASPDLILSNEDINLGTDVVEDNTIRSLHPFPGDTIVEGRLGNSLRFSGYYHPNSKLTLQDKSNNGRPYAILRVGQDTTEDSLLRYTEDINQDASSLYLTSDHSVNIEESTSKRDTYRDNVPESLRNYQGKQVIIDSGRIVFHSKEDHILLSSKNSVGLTGFSANIDATEYTSIDSPNIFLGSSAQESVLKGDTTVQLLNDILNALTSLATTHQLATTPALASTQLVAGSAELIPKLQTFKSRLESLKSKKVFVE